jgi:prepilin-type N-terminal cleavage/methylation domain-containing protein
MLKSVKSQMPRAGFTLIEIMIVMAIIGIVALVSIPNYVRSRNQTQKNVCINNLRTIDRLTQQWAFENQKLGSGSYLLNDSTLLSHFKGSVLPLCPGYGSYSPGATSAGEPTCSLAALGHTL